MQCPRCQHKNRAQAKFCDACGAPVARLEGGAQPAPSYAEVQRSLSEALDQQTATSEILRVISSAPTDVQPVFETIVKNAARLCDAFDAVIFQVDAGVLRLVAHEGSVSVGPVGQFTVPLVQGVLTGRVALERRAIQVADHQAADDEYPEGTAIARRYGVRTMLGVPLMLASEAVGVIALRRAEVRPFTDRQIELLKTFADQAVIAIENVRLFTELQQKNEALTQAHAQVSEALEQQMATSEILRVISHSPTDVQPVLDAVAESAARLCGAVDAIIQRVDGDMIYRAAHVGAITSVSDVRPVTWATPSGRAIMERRTIHVDDILDEFARGNYLEARMLQQGSGFRTVLVVPLMREDAVIGIITIRRLEMRPFTGKQIALLQTFADQAVIAIENVRLFTELQHNNQALTRAHAQVTEALDQQTATSEILRVISSSPTDVQPVFDAIAESSVRLCSADYGSACGLEGDVIHLVAQRGQTAHWLETAGRLFPHPLNRDLIAGWAMLDRDVVHVQDMQDDARFPASQALARTMGYRTALSVPMLRDSGPAGAIVVFRQEGRRFTDAEIALLRTFADQAVIAIENVRLFKELEARNAELTDTLARQTATGEVLRAISRAQTDAQPVFDIIAESAQRLCGAGFGQVALYDGALLHMTAFHNVNPEGVEALRRRFPAPADGGSAMGRALQTRAVVQIPDVLEDPAYAFKSELQTMGFHSLLVVPMLRKDESIGAIAVGRLERGAFPGKQIELLQTFADQAVIAIENVRLFTELQEKNRALTQAHRQVTEALEQQTATGEILRVISQSPTDVQPVLDAVAESATRLCRAYDAIVLRLDGDILRRVAHHGRIPSDPGLVMSATSRGTVTGRAVLDRQPIHVADLQAETEDFPEGSTYARRNGHRSILSVPLLREGVAIGAINIRRTEVQPFTDSQIVLLQTFADQAVIAIENVRLFTELQASNRELTTALDTQTATSDILRVISRSQTDVQPVFDAIVDSAVRLLRAYSGVLTRVNSDQIELAALTSTNDAGDAAARTLYPEPLQSERLTARAIRERAPLNVADADTDPRLPEAEHARARVRGYRSLVVVPMLRHEEAVGAIAVTRREAGGFTDDEIALLQTFADQAVIAIENARLLSELQARTGELTQSVAQLTALSEVSRAVSSTLDVETVLDTIVSRASQLAGAAGCSIYEYDEGAEQFELRATHNDDTEFVEALRAARLRKGEGLMGRAAEMREPIQIPDITQPGAYQSGVRDTLIRFGYRALLAVPLLLEDQIIGSLSFNRKTPGAFSPEVVNVLKTFATQSALAIQNARLFREIADKSQQLEAASRHKSEFLANMSHELRTPLNAIIGFSEVLAEKMFGEVNDKQAEYLQDILESGRHLLSLINDILDLSKIEAGRMELELAAFDLPSAIENALILVRERASRRGIRLGSTIDTRLGMISGDERKVKQVLLNILSNALKFTPEGGRIDIDARLHADRAEVSVTDTGVGIAPGDQEAVFEEFRQVGTTDKKAEGTGLGLALSRRFIELHGGQISVQSEVGRGSTFTFTLPVSPWPAS